MPIPTQDQVLAVLSGVNDPEIRKPITDLGMVRDVVVSPDGLGDRRDLPHRVGLPDADDDHERRHSGGPGLDGVRDVVVDLDVMSDEQRRALRENCAAARPSARSRSPSPAP